MVNMKSSVLVAVFLLFSNMLLAEPNSDTELPYAQPLKISFATAACGFLVVYTAIIVYVLHRIAREAPNAPKAQTEIPWWLKNPAQFSLRLGLRPTPNRDPFLGDF